MKKPLVFLDLDHTLIENPFATAVFPEVCGKIGAESGQTSDSVLWEIFREQKRRAQDGTNPVRELDWQDIVECVAKTLRVEFRDDLESLVRKYSRPPHSFAYPGAREALLGMRRRCWTLIASSKGLWRYQSPVLCGLELLDLFDGFAMPDLVGCRKTERGFYEPFTKGAGTIVTVGDNLEEDILYPMKFGYRAILRRFDHSSHPIAAVLARSKDYPEVLPDATIDSLDELIPSISALLAAG